MSLHTIVPLEIVLDGWSRQKEVGPFVDMTVRGVTMRVIPVSPGVYKIERLLSAPLECYLAPEFQPGRLVFYPDHQANEAWPGAGDGGFWPLPPGL